MTHVIYTDQLNFRGDVLSVHLASDRQIYVRLDELCNFIGMDPSGKERQIRDDISTADLLRLMNPRKGSEERPDQEKVTFLNLAALPYWLGIIRSEKLIRRDLHDSLVRYTFDFLDVSWIMYRAALHELEPAAVNSS